MKLPLIAFTHVFHTKMFLKTLALLVEISWSIALCQFITLFSVPTLTWQVIGSYAQEYLLNALPYINVGHYIYDKEAIYMM